MFPLGHFKTWILKHPIYTPFNNNVFSMEVASGKKQLRWGNLHSVFLYLTTHKTVGSIGACNSKSCSSKVVRFCCHANYKYDVN